MRRGRAAVCDARRAALAVALALGLAPGGAAAGGLGTVEILADAGGALGLLSRPATGPGDPARLAAVVVVHDGLGHDRRSEGYTRQLLGASLAVLEIELQTHPADGAGPTQAEPDRLRRAIAALAGDPGVDPARIGALGFGEGGRALVLSDDERALGAHVLLYPGCGALLAAVSGDGLPNGRSFGAVLLMHGGADPANVADDCAGLAGRLAGHASEMRLTTWSGASYGWDIPRHGDSGTSRHPAPGGGAAVPTEAWPELAALSSARTAAFLDAALALERP